MSYSYSERRHFKLHNRVFGLNWPFLLPLKTPNPFSYLFVESEKRGKLECLNELLVLIVTTVSVIMQRGSRMEKIYF